MKLLVAAACLVVPGAPAAGVLALAEETTTHNWSGMLARDGTADGIDTLRGAVIVPHLRCGPATSIVSVWIGFGGAKGSMPQIGFHGTCEAGRASYTGFYEWFDAKHQHNASTLLPSSRLRLAEGDLVSLTVTAGRRGAEAWRGGIVVAPLTGAGSQIAFTIPREAGASSKVGRTAECIVERPGRVGSGQRYPLADFGTIQWASCGVEKALSTTGALAQNQRAYAPVAGGAWRQAGRRGHGDRTSFGVDRYAMRSGREVLASTSSSTLATDTRSAQRVRTLGGFDVAWHAPGVDSASVLPPLPPHK